MIIKRVWAYVQVGCSNNWGITQDYLISCVLVFFPRDDLFGLKFALIVSLRQEQKGMD